MIKPISELLKNAYYTYYDERGIPPTKFSVGIEYRDEWHNNVFSNIVIYNASVLNGDKDSYMGIPIQWVKRRRIECLPRKKRFGGFKKFVMPVIHTAFPTIKIEDVFKV